MNESHPLLSQMPLTSTLFPPSRVRLSYSYTPLPPSLPQTQVSEENLQAWIQECGHVKESLKQYGSKEMIEYEQWENGLLKMAPGYTDHGLLTPQKVTGATNIGVEKGLNGLNIK